MRTTVTLEDDVASALARMERNDGVTFKEAINTALREFLARRARKQRSGSRYRTPSVNLGPCLVGTVDDIGDALALGEGDNFR